MLIDCRILHVCLSILLLMVLTLAPDALAAKKSKQKAKSAAREGLEKAITVTGTGGTRNDAIQDALRNAVERATGVFVYSVSEVKNFQLEKDKIIAASRGFVKDYAVMDERKYDGVYILTATVTVNDEAIKSILRENVKAMTYDDVIKDYLLVTQMQERLRKFAGMLQELSSRPLSERFIVENAGYDIKSVGLEKVSVFMKVRISANPFFWDTYFRVLEQVSDCSNRENMVISSGKRKFCIHKDLYRYTIQPFISHIEYYPDGIQKCRREKEWHGQFWKWADVCTKEVPWLVGAVYSNVISRDCFLYAGIAGTPGREEVHPIPSTGLKRLEWNFSCRGNKFSEEITTRGKIVEIPLMLSNSEDVRNLHAMKFKFRGLKLYPGRKDENWEVPSGKIVSWKDDYSIWELYRYNRYYTHEWIIIE
jgi:hypothetical protein